MEFILRDYSVNQPTWLYLSSLLILAVYFRFNRVFSLRNLDLLLLMAISPGILIVSRQPDASIGFIWLVSVTSLLLIRVLIDPLISRRPRFEQNLNAAGLMFLGIAAFGFITTRAITDPIPISTVTTIQQAESMMHGENPKETTPIGPKTKEKPSDVKPGPTGAILTAPVLEGSKHLVAEGDNQDVGEISKVEWMASRIMAILCHASIIIGLYLIGRWRFADPSLGVAMATLYLLLPCTAYKVGELNQVLPAALILWGILMAQRPIISGVLLALACGTMFFPIFLVPIWVAYQGRQKLIKFSFGFCAVMMVLFGVLLWTSEEGRASLQGVLGSIDWSSLGFDGGVYQDEGFWAWLHPAYRIPVMVTFMILVCVMTIWPFKKSYESLVSSTVAIVVATQLWYPQQGGIYVLWYLPLMLLITFKTRTPSATEMGNRILSSPVKTAANDGNFASKTTGAGRGQLRR